MQDSLLLEKVRRDYKRKEVKRQYLDSSWRPTAFNGHKGTIYSLKFDNKRLVTGSAGLIRDKNFEII